MAGSSTRNPVSGLTSDGSASLGWSPNCAGLGVGLGSLAVLVLFGWKAVGVRRGTLAVGVVVVRSQALSKTTPAISQTAAKNKYLRMEFFSLFRRDRVIESGRYFTQEESKNESAMTTGKTDFSLRGPNGRVLRIILLSIGGVLLLALLCCVCSLTVVWFTGDAVVDMFTRLGR
jgi:hypothetical protein